MTATERLLATALLADAFHRVHESLPSVVAGLAPDDLLWRPGSDANPIAWLVWHLTRVQDDHVADLGGVEQVWTAGGWHERFALPYPVSAVGYGQTASDVAGFVLRDHDLLIGYHAATHAMTLEVIGALTDDDYARVVDDQWDPPVTAAVRLVSVVNDITQHLGQAAYVRGLLDHR